MKRLSDNAIEIVNELHTEKLAYESEYVPIIDALNRLAEYEDTRLEPEKIVFLKNVVDDAFSDKPEFTEHIRELLRTEKDGRLVVLPCRGGLTMTECNWCKDEICVNADCPICCDYCPVPDTEGVCKFEDRSERHFTVEG